MYYIYFGDDATDPRFVKQKCWPVYKQDGKPIRGDNNTMLVRFESGVLVVIDVRLLRKGT
jgi:hypothetical protein